MRLFVSHIVLIYFRKIWIQLFYPQQWVNSMIDYISSAPWPDQGYGTSEWIIKSHSSFEKCCFKTWKLLLCSYFIDNIYMRLWLSTAYDLCHPVYIFSPFVINLSKWLIYLVINETNIETEMYLSPSESFHSSW